MVAYTASGDRLLTFQNLYVPNLFAHVFCNLTETTLGFLDLERVRVSCRFVLNGLFATDPSELLCKAKYLEDWHSARCAVRPGMSGLWQISTDGRFSFDDMVRLDLRYMQDWSLRSDVRILLGTVKTVLTSRPV